MFGTACVAYRKISTSRNKADIILKKMSQANPGNSTAASVSILPAKRRRGRPRKDENRNYMGKAPAPAPAPTPALAATPVSDLPRRNQPQSTVSTANTDNALVGQIVSGVLDGSFDAGYLLTVRVGNTSTVLRGVVFEPGLSVPISADNDVAPHVKLFKRSEFPLPVIIPLNQVPATTPHHEAKSEQPAKHIPKTVTAIPLEVPLGDNNCLPKQPSDDAKHASQVAPQDNQSSIRTESSDILLSKGQVDGVHQMPPISSQASPSNIEKGKSTDTLSNMTSPAPKEAVTGHQPPPITTQVTEKSDMTTLSVKSSDEFNQPLQDLPPEPKTENPAVALQESEHSLQPRLSNGTTATDDLKQEPKANQSVEISSGASGKEGLITINQLSPEQTNTLESALPSVDALKGVPAEIYHPSPATPIGVSQENKTSLFGGSASDIQAYLVTPQETISNVSTEILKRDEAGCLIEGLRTDLINTAKDNFQARPTTDALYDIQSGYAAHQSTLTQHSVEPQSYGSTAPTQEESLITKDAVSMQAPNKPVELGTSTTGSMEPEAADHTKIN